MMKNGQGHSALPYFSLISHTSFQQNITHLKKGQQMAEQLDPNEMVRLKDLVVANSIQVDAMAMLLIEKGLITKDELFTMLKKVQMEYQSKHDT